MATTHRISAPNRAPAGEAAGKEQVAFFVIGGRFAENRRLLTGIPKPPNAGYGTAIARS
jgi:hypothetical protein